MDKDLFISLVKAHILPMFPGVSIDTKASADEGIRNVVSTCSGYTALKIRPSSDSDYHIRIVRAQPFDSEEIAIIKCIIEELNVINDLLEGPHGEIIKKSSIVLAISKSITRECYTLLKNVIDTFSQWSEETYEGARISAAVCIGTNDVKEKGILFSDMANDPSLKIIGNGIDTAIEISKSGIILHHVTLYPEIVLGKLKSKGRSVSRASSKEPFSPARFVHLARYANNGRIVIALNRAGEILIFNNNNLEFARRSGVWKYFPHKRIIAQLGNKKQEWHNTLLTQVYLSMLDVSFGRKGGCIGIIRREHWINFSSKQKMDKVDRQWVTSVNVV